MDISQIDYQNKADWVSIMDGCDTIIHSLVPDLDKIPEDSGELIKKCIN
jgi:hypothetical protein